MSLGIGHVSVPLDAWSFRAAASALGGGDFGAYTGARPPVFPLLLIATRGNDHALWIVQSLIGIGAAWVLFHVTLAETRSRVAAVVAGSSIGLGFYALSAEASVMSECVLAGLLGASLLVARRIVTAPRSSREFLLLGCLAGFAVLTRPMFIYLPLAFAIAARGAGRRKVTLLLGSSGGIVVAWSVFNWFAVDYFGPTTLLGFNLTNHCGGFIERAGPEFASIRDVYLKYRAARVAQFGDHMQTIWDALPEMMSVTGLSFSALSKRCLSMCLALIVDDPGAYLASVGRALGRFMLAPNYRGGSWLPPSGPVLARTWDVQEAIFITSKFALLLLAPLAFKRGTTRFAQLVVGMVVGGAVFQALLELGENDRYSVPLQPWAVCGVALLASAWARGRSGGPAPATLGG